MSNYYAVIIVLFALSGFLGAIWSWLNIRKAKKCLTWPSVKGVVVGAISSAEAKKLTPRIEYRYTVEGQDYDGIFELASSDVVLPELAAVAVDKYPIESAVDVHYDPEAPGNSILEPGIKKDDWLVFGVCTGSLVTGFLYLVFNV